MDCEGGDCEEGMGSDCDMGVEPEPPAVKSGMAEVRGAVDGKDRGRLLDGRGQCDGVCTR